MSQRRADSVRAYLVAGGIEGGRLQTRGFGEGKPVATSDKEGNVQLLLWDFTYTLPEGVNNQQYYVKDLPAKAKGSVSIRISGLMEGGYTLRVSRVGYRKNDAYTAYIAMGSPPQLTRAQVQALKAEATGDPERQEEVRVAQDRVVATELPLRENDVYLVELLRSQTR